MQAKTTLTITLRGAAESSAALREFAPLPLPGLTALALARMRAQLEPHAAAYESARAAVLAACGTLIKDRPGGFYQITKPEDFAKQIGELDAQEVEIDMPTKPLYVEDIVTDEARISAQSLYTLSWLLKSRDTAKAGEVAS